MDAGPLAPQPPRPERTPRAGEFMSCLSTAVVCWLLIGSISHSPAARDALGDAFIAVAIVVGIGQVLLLLLALDTASGLWPGRSSAFFTAAIVGFGAASSYAITVARDWAHWGQGLFWALGGIYGGVALETATGFWSRTQAWLESSARAG